MKRTTMLRKEKNQQGRDRTNEQKQVYMVIDTKFGLSNGYPKFLVKITVEEELGDLVLEVDFHLKVIFEDVNVLYELRNTFVEGSGFGTR